MQDHLLRQFGNIQNASWNPSWLVPYRQKAFEQFLEFGFPSRSDEDWSYTNTKTLENINFQVSAKIQNYPDIDVQSLLVEDCIPLVFINGVFQKQLNSSHETPELIIQPLGSELRNLQLDNQTLLPTSSTFEKNSFEQLNRALFNTGCLILVKQNTHLAKPIHLLYLNTEQEDPLIISPRNIFHLDKDSSAHVVETYINPNNNLWLNGTTEFQLESYAELHLAQETVAGSGSFHTHRTRMSLKRGSKTHSFNLSLGGRMNRSELLIELSEEEATAQLDGLAIGRDRAHIDQNTCVTHLSPHTQSDQIYKSLLSDQSRSIFNGKIAIVKHAQQSQAYQLSKNLLLSPNAEADARPQLRIDADDVRCSHGAAIGQVDSQEIFYLQSRGISKEESENILAKAFIRDVLGRVKSHQLAKRLAESLYRYAALEV